MWCPNTRKQNSHRSQQPRSCSPERYSITLQSCPQWRRESFNVREYMAGMTAAADYIPRFSRDRPDVEESCGGSRALREHIRQDASVDEPNPEGKTGNGPEDSDQEAATNARPNQDLGGQ